MAGGGGAATGGAAPGGEGGTGGAATFASSAGARASGARGGGGASGAWPLARGGLGSRSHGGVKWAFCASGSLPHAAASAVSTSAEAMPGWASAILGRSASQKASNLAADEVPGHATPWKRRASSTWFGLGLGLGLG